VDQNEIGPHCKTTILEVESNRYRGKGSLLNPLKPINEGKKGKSNNNRVSSEIYYALK
jgi:hypothetical protein